MDLINFENFFLVGFEPFKLLLIFSLLILGSATLILFYHWWKYRGDGILIWFAGVIYSVGTVFLLMTTLAAYSILTSL